MSYPKYGWVGNRIAEADMAALYKRKKATRKSITAMVAEAVICQGGGEMIPDHSWYEVPDQDLPDRLKLVSCSNG